MDFGTRRNIATTVHFGVYYARMIARCKTKAQQGAAPSLLSFEKRWYGDLVVVPLREIVTSPNRSVAVRTSEESSAENLALA